MEDQATIKESLHGREILAAASIKVSDHETLIVTGSEDTYLKVSLYNKQANDLKMLKTFSNHIASIRCICKAKVYQNLQKGSPGQRSYGLVSAGSRQEANVYMVSLSP